MLSMSLASRPTAARATLAPPRAALRPVCVPVTARTVGGRVRLPAHSATAARSRRVPARAVGPVCQVRERRSGWEKERGAGVCVRAWDLCVDTRAAGGWAGLRARDRRRRRVAATERASRPAPKHQPPFPPHTQADGGERFAKTAKKALEINLNPLW